VIARADRARSRTKRNDRVRARARSSFILEDWKANSKMGSRAEGEIGRLGREPRRGTRSVKMNVFDGKEDARRSVHPPLTAAKQG
jgi:hypothetical protein